MRKEVLLVYVGLAINVDEGAKHRLNSFINEYNKIGFKVTVLAFCKKGLFLKDKKRYLNSNASWLLLPY
ncbi:glycosyl transferase group 1, partial [Bacteroides thetaiotaomicron]|nr:glycosyl transferase group 1 [Bacteroides thetaiotaomicron]